MKATILVIMAVVLLAGDALAQRGPCQPTPFNPSGINCNGYGGYRGGWGVWDPYPGTRGTGQDAVNIAQAVAIGAGPALGLLSGVIDLFTPEPNVVVVPEAQQVAAAPQLAVPAVPAGNWKKCFWLSYNPTIANPRYRYGDRRYMCVGPNGEYIEQAPPIQ
jgi:hypothetical protein